MNGKNVVIDLAKDLERFFFHNKLNIKMEFDSNSRHNASYVGTDQNERLRFSKDFCDFQISTLRDFFFIAIISAHEFAHYLHHHNNVEDEDDIDSMSLETWADFYGARLFFTLITFGKRTNKSMSKIQSPLDQNIILHNIGLALSDVHEYIYKVNNSKKYQSPIQRVSIFCSGVISFFYRLYGTVKVEWSSYVNITILRAAGLSQSFGDENVDWPFQEELISLTLSKHREIQGRKFAITMGLKPFWYQLISTSYALSDLEVEKHKLDLIEQVESQGINLTNV